MNRVLKTAIWLIMVLPLAYLAFVWNSLPETIATHFNLQGEPNAFGSKDSLLTLTVVLTILNMGIYLLLTNINRIDPKRHGIENKPRMERLAIVISVFLSAILCFVIYSNLHLDSKFNSKIIFAGIGILLAFIGNYIHNIKPNYFAGIRLPWTLENEDNWRKTHLLAGKLFFAGGLIMTLVCLLVPNTVAIVVFISITCILILVPCIYSYLLYKQSQKQ